MSPLVQILKEVAAPHTHFAFGPLDLWLQRDLHDWRIAIRRDASAQDRWKRQDAQPDPEESGSLSWRRFSCEDEAQTLQVSFQFPASPVVIRPDEPYLIAPGDKVQFFVSVPISVRLTAKQEDAPTLIEEPTTILSKTWFGDPVNGELCLGSRTRAKRSVEDLDKRRYRIICPIRMRNTAREVLTFERFCLRVQFLRLYAGKEHFWSNEIGVTYRGSEQVSRVAYHPRGPSFDQNATQITPARDDNPSQLDLRSFYSGVMDR